MRAILVNSDYQQVLNEITAEVQPLLSQGKVADYIPALAEVKANQFSMAIHTTDGETFCAGDCSGEGYRGNTG